MQRRHPVRQDYDPTFGWGGEVKLTFGEDERPHVEALREFLGLTAEQILASPLTNEDRYRLGQLSPWRLYERNERNERRYLHVTPNRRLALRLYEVEPALRALCESRGGIVEDDQLVCEDNVPIGTRGRLGVFPNGFDFGVQMSFAHTMMDRMHRGRPQEAVYSVVVPAAHYLNNVLELGDLHEPVFGAVKPDLEGPLFANSKKSWPLPGVMQDCTVSPSGQWRRMNTTFFPLYYPYDSDDAMWPSIEGYLGISQMLVSRFLDAAVKIEPDGNPWLD